MRKLYDEFFKVEEGQKIREKVLYARIAVYLTFVVILMATMSFAAFGYFSSDVTSGANRIKASSYTLEIQVLDGENDLYMQDGMTLEPGDYQVILSYVEGSSSTGFGILEVGNQVFHTLQIGTDTAAENGFRSQVSFTLQVKESVPVRILPSWGTSVYYGSTDSCYIQDSIWIIG